mgnify:CR=1 FL=1
MATINLTSAANFIPEIWQDEVRAAYETGLMVGKLCKKISHKGKYGDKIHIPDISNLVANSMVAGGEVSAQSVTEGEFSLDINKWEEASFRYADIVKVQSKYDLRSEYTKKAGYAIAKKVEQDLMALFANSAIQGYDADGTAEATGGGVITRAGILTAIQYLDDNDVPNTDRVLIVPPSARNTMLQIAEFTSVDYVNKKATETAKFGEILGLDVYVSTLCPNYTVSTSKKNAIVMHKDAIALAEQVTPRTQAQYEQKYLSWLVTTDTVYGVARFRATNAVRLRLDA